MTFYNPTIEDVEIHDSGDVDSCAVCGRCRLGPLVARSCNDEYPVSLCDHLCAQQPARIRPTDVDRVVCDWMSSPDETPWLIVLVAAAAATAGRLVLAKLAYIIVRQRWLSARTRENIDLVKDRLATQPALTFGGPYYCHLMNMVPFRLGLQKRKIVSS